MNRDSNTFVVVLILAISVALAGVGIALLMSTGGPAASAVPERAGWFGNAKLAAEKERRLAADMAAKAAADAAKIEKARRAAEQAAKEKQKQDEPKAKPVEREETKPQAKEEMKKEEAKPKPAPTRTEEEEEAAERFRDSTIAREAVAREGRRKNLLANRTIPSGRFNLVMCAEKSAADFEQSFFEDEPEARTSIAFVDVATSDGSLIVHFTQAVEKGPEVAQKAAADVVIRAWRQSKFTTKLGFSKTVEFRGSDRVLFTDGE